jgi:hypothetical protein
MAISTEAFDLPELRHLAHLPEITLDVYKALPDAMAYDAATNQLLLFGGGTSHTPTALGYHGDTWVWDGSNWTQLHPVTSPPARQNPDMVYDAARQQIVLYGGYDGQYLSDTWTWNGTTWKLV